MLKRGISDADLDSCPDLGATAAVLQVEGKITQNQVSLHATVS